MTVSVIIPTLNEEKKLPELLSALWVQTCRGLEVIVGDGGSTDRTVEIAEHWGARVVTCGRGRGRQMNAAALSASGAYLFFLHADSCINEPELLDRAVCVIEERIALMGHNRIAGHFRLRFKTLKQRTIAYDFLEAKSALNRADTINGDQGFLMQAEYFRALGGFDESLPFLEDQRLAHRIRESGVWLTLTGTIETSARRFEEEGFARRYILMAIIMGLNDVGLNAFFEAAPHAYRVQHETRLLLLTPFFRIIRRITRDMGLKRSFITWLRVGRYIKRNAWQIFFFLDVVLKRWVGGTRYQRNMLLSLHDRIVRPVLDFRVFDWITAGLAYVWIMSVLASWYRIRDHRALKQT